METIYQQLELLVRYGVQKNLISELDTVYVRNLLLDVLDLDEPGEAYTPDAAAIPDQPAPILEPMLDWAYENGRFAENTVTERDLYDTKLMSCLTVRPAEVTRHFKQIYHERGAEEATADFYQFSQDTHYIRQDRVAKNESWAVPTEFGELEVTINLSKPEKDPKEIEKAKQTAAVDYPQCPLCIENVGYRGRSNHPARQTLRTVPLTLLDEQWHLQFSPYVYYHEHAIVLKDEHVPMKITAETFERLLQFTDAYPHYFIGSNADLPIVGGSILSHDHFQAGKHEFPMAKAAEVTEFTVSGFEDVRACSLKWPMSAIRLQGADRESVREAAVKVFEAWKAYSDRSVGIYAFTGDTPHNTVTPIARTRDGRYELDLILRNNRTDDTHPAGIFHPHADVHHIKKENIGLIEAMGLAILPGRLKEELALLAEALTANDPAQAVANDERIEKHADWAKKLVSDYPDVDWQQDGMPIFEKEIGLIFARILTDAGVFKQDDTGQHAFKQFLHSLSE
ncbi:UDP-glucose--hexose-1-phosphate uridylyltransferase [Salisediminibacterium halotolerans]|uniref:UDP-glucose--hexose-1-phosphate uridylyltransferase n=1 Tax=Salisediminibacterium halotolerans TaxID=517425 RepID=UPI000EB174ED|nr:UDP-glucose--hexose-1-phosphate uridylyltransferase [Salisediminibacterium halotolerans]RLJ75765.1 UTP-hexose-1-phosphate uridylyltransferase [Actinophytocola xinjiangensis]RPE89619.1 UTP-hexose-1-phosphate uridylyltransferase [Salisediminibacterium halotolerans]TWG36378.1 UTP-hexose-1-phosphate uridylyltransferase [Salisediminibacterium halotolerans]GEL07545.1 galactose-1-phosphate uridylyltransferase [Salisediminibacterium halotolerans]